VKGIEEIGERKHGGSSRSVIRIADLVASADGITENLTTELSRRIKGSFVIARNTAFAYKCKLVDAKEIGKELGVRACASAIVFADNCVPPRRSAPSRDPSSARVSNRNLSFAMVLFP
jgi:hypothetical protein